MRRWGRIAFTAVSAVLTVMMPMAAQGFTYPATPPGILGRAEFDGYWTNVHHTCGDSVLYNGLGYNRATNVFNPAFGFAMFVSEIHTPLFGAATGQDQSGAAFIVLTMLGVKGSAAGGSAAGGVAMARSLYSQWLSKVTYYNSIPGKVEWARSVTYPFDGTSTFLNTLYMGRDNCTGPPIPPDTKVPNDEAFFSDNTVQTRPTVIFHNNDGTRYMIKRNCANPVGDLDSLKDGAYDYQAVLGVTGATPSPGTPVLRGQVLTLNAHIHNAGTIIGPAGALSYIPHYVPAPAGAEVAIGATAAVNAGGNSASLPFSVTVSAAAPVGAQICVTARARPHTTDSPPDFDDSAPDCWPIATVSFPAVVGTNGDIHAGGGRCGGVQANGFVKGYPGAGSGGQYVVSASAAGIDDFTSNGTGPDTLQLGNGGSYLQVCRPDLVKAALAYQTAGLGWSGIATGSSVDVGTLPAAWDVFIANGPISIHGTVNRKITIVDLSAAITIDGPIKLDNVLRPRTALASLGVISASDININASVTQVDAYLFANGAIDTCLLASGSCANTLTVNGFLMANTLVLHRLGPPNILGKTVGEQVILNPQIYLNPPKLMDASIDDTLLEGQGEKQPLF